MPEPPARARGCLYVVGVPIGQPEDLTLRARRVLAEVDWILAEDPARTQGLLAHHRLATPVTSYHPDSKEEKAALALARIGQGESLALVCDAGTPLVCDPGSYLVEQAHRAGVRVIPVPGASALMTALSVAGVPADRFVFHGMLPRRGPPRRHVLDALGCEERTQVLFIAPGDLRAVLAAAGLLSRDRTVVVTCDLTREGERIVSGSVRDLLAQRGRRRASGEVTVVVGPLAGPPVTRTGRRPRGQPSVSGRRRMRTR